ncbi:MAG: pyridoxamine kinase [Eubacteriales bacterium]|nr:pyridoxamine kinase [Eubacteriales bacterium]
MKRIVTIQDISCVGKCSLTVALPIISAMGIETSVIPTAVLSAHTAFDSFTFHDLTDEIPKIQENLLKNGISFDAIYTGYLGSYKQLDIVIDFIDKNKKDDTLIFVDPVMADNGELYSGFDIDFARSMRNLCSKADIITPNLTEASYLLDVPYVGDDYDDKYIKNILLKLCETGAKKAILTGVSYTKGKLGAVSYDSENDRFYEYFNKHIPVAYHGTGDIFASSCLGGIMNEISLDNALSLSVDFVLDCIEKTNCDPDHRWYGVNFEKALPMLIERIK